MSDHCPACDAAVDPTDGTAYLHGDGTSATLYCSRECAHAE